MEKIKTADEKDLCLESDLGITAIFSPLGAALKAMYVPDKSGNLENIVYYNPLVFGGAVIAPVAGRVRKGEVIINGSQYKMPCDESDICLHSGEETTGKRLWTVSEHTKERLVFITHLPNGTCGLPGNRSVRAEYCLKGNVLSLSIIIDTDCDTFVNPTSHIYWNLSGDFNSGAKEHLLEIASKAVYHNDKRHLPQKLCDTNASPFDFSKPLMWDSPPSNNCQIETAQGYNHAFVLDKNEALKLSHTASGRTLKLTTNAPHLVFYSGGFLPVPSCAAAFEPQLLPDAPYLLKERLPVLKAGHTFLWKSEFEFGISE